MPYYFAYGSNMDEEQMKERCPKSEVLGIGYLSGYKLGFTRFSEKRQSAVADILVSPDDNVWGLIYEVPEADMERLDHFEGAPDAYQRIYKKVYQYKSPTIEDMRQWFYMGNTKTKSDNHHKDPKNYKTVDCFTYEVAHKNFQVGPPTVEYMDKLTTPAVTHNFPDYYQEMLNGFMEDSRLKKRSSAIDLCVSLMDFIKSNQFQEKTRNTREWGGAELVITGNLKRKEELAQSHPNYIVVLTPYWKELSWLVKMIYSDENINWNFNHINKFHLFKEIGESAITYQSEQSKEDSSYIGICEAVLIKAYSLFT